MSTKPLIVGALLSLYLAWPAAAQSPAGGGPMSGGNPAGTGPMGSGMPMTNNGSAAEVLQPNSGMSPMILTGVAPPPGSAASNWMNGGGTLPIGRDGPIGQEIYWHTGPTIPIGRGALARGLNTGWMTEAGGRALLFNAANDAAITAQIGLAFQYNDGSGKVAPYNFFRLPVRTRDLFRWSGTWAVGRDWFLIGQGPFGNGNNLRFGADIGGHYGTSHVNLNVLNVANDPFNQKAYLRRQDQFGGFVLGTHADIEIPFPSWVLFAGIRSEWGYDWSTLLLVQNSSIQNVNILFTLGFRY